MMTIDINDLSEEKIIDMIEPHLAKMYEAGFAAGLTQLHDAPLRAGDRVRHDKFPTCRDGVVLDVTTSPAAPEVEFVVVYWRNSTMGIAHHPAVRLSRIGIA